MPYTADYSVTPPTRAEIDALPGTTVLEFGTGWCGWCRGARPFVEAVLGPRADVRHVKVEDGPGRTLGRSFGVKLWPTLVVLEGGVETGRVVRPADAAALTAALGQ